jgi:tol-pal system protein YbgF
VTNRIACYVLIAGTTWGCASPMSAMRADNRRLSTDVSELRADRRAQDRKLKDLENQLALSRANQPVSDMPKLPVEVMVPVRPIGPADPRVVAVAEDGTEIVYEGDAALGKPAQVDLSAMYAAPSQSSGTVAAANDRIEIMHGRVPPISARSAHRTLHKDVDSVTPTNPTNPTNDAAAGDYRAAVELVKSGKHDEAVAALRLFLKTYPRHDYADNAQYWLGESFYAQKDYTHALTEFRSTIETYPRGNKVPDALLKVGYCYQALGQSDKARAVLEQVVNLYPKSEPAALASKKLETP